ncbi:MAG: hypothetical protein QOG97_849 [Acidimicrobiaceae bacterium]|nr:hypothetical protein [Acidimicrobiaceae bacterium]
MVRRAAASVLATVLITSCAASGLPKSVATLVTTTTTVATTSSSSQSTLSVPQTRASTSVAATTSTTAVRTTTTTVRPTTTSPALAFATLVRTLQSRVRSDGTTDAVVTCRRPRPLYAGQLVGCRLDSQSLGSAAIFVQIHNTGGTQFDYQVAGTGFPCSDFPAADQQQALIDAGFPCS